jgi:DNA-directed RNA polymerase subunit RPC12/RpoP
MAGDRDQLEGFSMLIPVVCKCGKTFNVKAERLGQIGKCPSCGSKILISLEEMRVDDAEIPSLLLDEVSHAHESFPADLVDTREPETPRVGAFLDSSFEAVTIQDLEALAASLPVAASDENGDGEIGEVIEIEEEQSMRQYKVLTQKDKWFSGKFDPERLEQAINSYAQQGWVVRAMTTASIPGFGGNRDELIVLLER